MIRIGVDIGGTKMAIAALDASGAELFRHRGDAPNGAYPDALRALADAVRDAEREAGTPCTVGIGTPGAVSAGGVLRNAFASVLNGKPLKPDLERLLGREVRFANDANCFALSEASDGAAAGASVVFGVIIGTGCGGGVVVNGAVLTGPNAIAGEWGHNPLPWPDDSERPGPECYCGKRGCLESFISGPGFARDYAVHAGVAIGSIDAAGVVARASDGNAQAAGALDRYVSRVARGLASIVNVLDPDVIVLGGGMSNVPHLYDAVPARLPQFVFSDAVVTRIVPPRHGDSSGVRGAAWLWSLDEARAITGAARAPRAGAGTAGA